jgi:hypothetical protein
MGSPSGSATPTGTWRTIDAGIALTCGERDTGAIECWGCYGEGGQRSQPYGKGGDPQGK